MVRGFLPGAAPGLKAGHRVGDPTHFPESMANEKCNWYALGSVNLRHDRGCTALIAGHCNVIVLTCSYSAHQSHNYPIADERLERMAADNLTYC
jgi:hypothetical protein